MSDDITDSELYEKHLRHLKEKEKDLIFGDDVVHLEYYEFLISKDDLLTYRGILADSQLRLSSFDRTGSMYASQEDFTNDLFLVFKDKLWEKVALGTAWEAIKAVVKSIYKKIKAKNDDEAKEKSPKAKEITFGFYVKKEGTTGYTFRFNTNSPETFDKALDLTKEVIKKIPPNSNFEPSLFMEFDRDKEKWVATDKKKIIAQQRKNHPKSKKKKKK